MNANHSDRQPLTVGSLMRSMMTPDYPTHIVRLLEKVQSWLTQTFRLDGIDMPYWEVMRDAPDTLFEQIDKTLYRGKTKGRNCYIIYVEEKHRDIEIKNLARSGICSSMQNLIRQFELVPTLPDQLRSVMPFLMEQLNVSDLYLVRPDGHICAVRDTSFSDTVSGLDHFLYDDFFSTNRTGELQTVCPSFYAMLKRHAFETVLIVRVAMDMNQYGYLMCAEPRSMRIWQEEECALVYFLAKLVASRLFIAHEELPASMSDAGKA